MTFSASLFFIVFTLSSDLAKSSELIIPILAASSRPRTKPVCFSAAEIISLTSV